MKKNTGLIAGADSVNITPADALYLAGYPFVERMSTGVHDPLFSTALFISDERTGVLFIANDVIFVGKHSVARVRRAVSVQTGLPEKNIMVTATHTHSGPSTVTFTAGTQDPVLPPVNAEYVRYLEEGMIRAACGAVKRAVPAELGMAVADATGIGTNRRDPSGPSDLQVPVLFVRDAQRKEPLACMLICSMHPTVLHEDSSLYSGDFPGLARSILQKEFGGVGFPILYHSGAAGNQSPRHVTRENTFPEAQRLGNILAQAVIRVSDHVEYSGSIVINALQHFIELPRRIFPEVREAQVKLERAAHRLEQSKTTNRTRQEIRTAEVNWFGAVESLHLAELSHSGALEEVYRTCLPAEIQLFRVGPWSFVAWPGEVFVEYGLTVKSACENVYIITLANGELQGYIVTEEAHEQGGYEASNAIFDYTSGELLVAETLHLLKNNQADAPVSGN